MPLVQRVEGGGVIVDGLTAHYGPTEVLHSISLTVDPGEFVGVHGPSGCGKSTLLQALGGLHHELSGTLTIDGIDIVNASPDQLLRLRRDTIGFVFQQAFLISEMTVAANVEFPLVLRGWSSSDRSTAVATILDRLGLSEHRNKLPHELSGGQVQRAAVARALVGRPTLVLADEPTGALDRANGTIVMESLRDLASDFGVSVVLVSHDDDALAYSDRVVSLLDGKVVATQFTQRLYTDLRS